MLAYWYRNELVQQNIIDMAKNTSSSAFRKINVDQYNEDNFKEDEIDTNGTTYTGPDDAEITKLLNAGKNNEALKLVLQNAPLTSKNQQTKVSSSDQAPSIFFRVSLDIDTV